MRRRRAGTLVLTLELTMVLAGCGLLPEPAEQPVPARTPSPVDVRLFEIDALAILRSLRGGDLCRQGSLVGSHGGDDAFHALADFTCPRAGDDRTIYFIFADAYQAALVEAGAVLTGSGQESGDATEPVATDWTIRGGTTIGTARVIGENGPGTLHIIVSLDLVAP